MNRAVGAAVAVVGIVATLVVSGCAQGEPPTAAVPSVATFQVIEQQFKVELITPELVANAEALLRGEEAPSIPVGLIVRDDPSVTEPWSWHIDPATVEFADMTIEVCDGLPEYVEDFTLTSNTYCPWSATIIALEPLAD